MSHDDRIQQLTGLFLEDLRAPIEASFRQLLEQIMGMAAQDQAAAIGEAVARAAADHQAALEAAHAAASEDREQALAAARADVAKEHEEAVEALRAELSRGRDEALDALRTELGQQHEAALASLHAEKAAEHEAALASLHAEKAAEHEASQESLRTEKIAEHQAALEALRAEMAAEREAALEALRAEMAAEREAALESLRAEKSAEHDAAVQDLVRNREDSLEALRQQAALQSESAVQTARDDMAREHEAALAALREQLEQEHRDAVARERDAAAGQHDTLMGDARAAAEVRVAVALAAVEQERDAARASVAELTDQLAAARAQHEQLTQLAHAESGAVEEMSAGAVEAHVVERQYDLACTERVVGAMRALDEARTLTDILTVLADHAASEASRVGVLLVQGTRLRGWRFAGMGDIAAASVDFPVERAGLIGRAVETAAPASSSDAKDLAGAALPPFLAAPADRVGLALPILVGGRVVAVLYADDSGSEPRVVPSNWPEVAEVLTRHAGRCLEVLTLSRAAARPPQEFRPPAGRVGPAASARDTDEAQEEESARRHARLLISEIKLYNEELVERGRLEGNLLALLASEIDRARRLYDEKIPAAVRQRVDCFDEEIVRTLAGGDATLLGQVT